MTAIATRTSTRKRPAPSPRPRPELLAVAVHALEDGKAEDIVVIDLEGKSSIADHMLVATAHSQRQVVALADRVMGALAEARFPKPAVEGLRQGDWVLIDAGDLIVHVFRPEPREFYNLEKMWGAALAEPGHLLP